MTFHKEKQMHHQGMAGTESGAIRGLGAVLASPKQPTINDRLNGIADRFENAARRIDSALSRIHGTPQADPGNAEKTTATIRSLAEIAAYMDSQAEYLTRLAESLESVA
jgi:hypothetical protein